MKKTTLALLVVALMGASSEMNAAANPNMSMMDRAKAMKARVGAAASSAASSIKNSRVGQAAGSAASKVGQGAANLAHKAANGAASLRNRATAAVRK